MSSRNPQPPRRLLPTLAVLVLAASLGGCLNRGAQLSSLDPATTGSIGSGPELRRASEELGRRYEANPADAETALAYARTLRAMDLNPQAVAALQQTTLRVPNNRAVLAAYGKALADAGRFREAQDVLSRSYLPERPDWRILSVQGAVEDQLGNFAAAQGFYDTALRLAPGEPSVLANQGLSFALARRLDDAERVLRQASASPGADSRVRRNLALVLGLKGRLPEAEAILKRDMPPDQVAADMGAMRKMVSQPDSWKTIRQSDRTAPETPPAGTPGPKQASL